MFWHIMMTRCYKICYKVFLAVVMGCLLTSLTACEPTGGQKPSTVPFVVTKNGVTLHKSHIISVKTKLYQPSFGLSGLVLPVNSANVLAPADGQLSIKVQTGQFVNQGHLLAVVTPKVIKSTPSADKTPKDDTLHSTQQYPKTDNLTINNLDTTDNPLTTTSKSLPATTSQADLDNTPSKDALKKPKNAQSNPINNPQNNQETILTDSTLVLKTPLLLQKPVPVLVTSPIDGVIVWLNDNAHTQKDNAIIQITDTRTFEFVARLPREFAPYLRIGDSVQFTEDTQIPQTRLDEITQHDKASFAGQIIEVVPNNDELAVTVQIKPKDNTLHKGMQLQGRIDYGQLSVGAVVPKHAIADGTSLNALQTPPHKPLIPIDAKVWIIGQDGKLYLKDTKVVEYIPLTKSYLVTGIDTASLIATANLPASANGLAVHIR